MFEYEPKVCIVILNWNNETDTIACLDSLSHLQYCNYEILIVDNGSQANSIDRVRQKYTDLTIIKNDKNLGYTGGNNIGINYALQNNYDFVLLLNSDTLVESDTLEKLVAAAAGESKIGIVGAVNCHYDNTSQYWYTGARINWWSGNYTSVKKDGNDIQIVDKVAGSCLLIKKELIERIGEFDQNFFAYFEESDLCFRCKKSGYKIVLSYEAKIQHKSHDYRKYLTANYFLIRNKPLFLLKNSPKYCLITSLPYYLYQTVLSILVSLLRREKKQAYVKYLGFRDCIIGRFGEGSLRHILELQG